MPAARERAKRKTTASKAKRRAYTITIRTGTVTPGEAATILDVMRAGGEPHNVTASIEPRLPADPYAPQETG